MHRFAWILLLLSVSDAAAAAEVPEEVYQHFLSVLPDSDTLKNPRRAPDPQELARLSALNPDKTARVQAILHEYEMCIGPANDAAIDRMLRHVVASLGEEKVRKLTAFYAGGELARAETLFSRIETGETLAPADQAEADALLARYPLAEFRDAMVPAGQDLATDKGFMDAVMGCAMSRAEALDREGIREDEE